MSRRKRFGEILVDAGVLNERNLEAALAKQRGSGKHLGQVLEDHGIITERDISIVLARQFGLKTVSDIARHSFSDELLKLVDSETALKKLIFPLQLAKKNLTLAMVNPLDMETIDDLSFHTSLSISPCVTTRAEIVAAVNKHYLGRKHADLEKVRTVLVADDQDLVRSTAVAALTLDGFQVLEATNGAEALKIALQRRPQVIITDTQMPKMSGQELFRTLQSSGPTRQIPVIGMSSKANPEDEARLLDLGYFDFVAKPINQVRLAARVRRAMRLVYGKT